MRALVVRAGALGDLLLLRPVVASLRAAGASVTLLAPERAGSALVGPASCDAERLISWDGPATATIIAGQAPPDFGAYDIVLCYSRSAELAAGLRRVGRQVVVCDPLPGRPSDSPDPRWLEAPLAALGLSRVEPPIFRATADEAALARERLAGLPPRFVAVHPGSGSPRKNWPFDRFAEVAGRLSEGRAWLLSLGPAEDDTTATGALVTRDLPPRALGALLAEAGLYVGNDSGVSHLAAAWGAPTLALFGPTDPVLWSPRGPRVRTRRAADEVMASIGVDEVVSCGRAMLT